MNRSLLLPRLLWLYVPALILSMQIGMEVFVSPQAQIALNSETGPHEMLQFLCIFLAFFAGVFALFKVDWRVQRPLGLWVAFATICALYVSGEELSWGQHVLEWSTPEYWAQINDQQETNLHNTSDWLDQKPRLLLFIGIVIGGLVVPALRRWKPSVLPEKFSAIYPPDCLAVTALGVLGPYTIDKITGIWGLHFFERVSEVQELFMYYFVLLYLIALRQTITTQAKIIHKSL